MAHKLDLNDFRAQRRVLDPSDFALGADEPEPAPSDLISEQTWNEIMTLPDDVLVRTTGHQGSRIEVLHDLWSAWLHGMPQEGVVFEAMLDTLDDLDAAVFNLMHGYYKQAITALRDSLELMTFACVCELHGEAHRWTDWQSGKQPLNFRDNCARIARHPKVVNLDAVGQHAYHAGVSLFPAGGDGDSARKAWITELYGRLCEYAHPRGMIGKLRQSNGPVYSAAGMETAHRAYLETYALLLLLAQLGAEQFRPPNAVAFLYAPETVDKYLGEAFRGVCTYYGDTLLYAAR